MVCRSGFCVHLFSVVLRAPPHPLMVMRHLPKFPDATDHVVNSFTAHSVQEFVQASPFLSSADCQWQVIMQQFLCEFIPLGRVPACWIWKGFGQPACTEAVPAIVADHDAFFLVCSEKKLEVKEGGGCG